MAEKLDHGGSKRPFGTMLSGMGVLLLLLTG